MVTLDERVEAMMTLNNRNWKECSSTKGRRGTGSRTDTPSRPHVGRDEYYTARSEYADSSRVQDDDSLISHEHERRRKPSFEQDDNCLLKCGRCLARIPCSAVCCWVFLCTAVAMCCGGILVSAYKGQDMFDKEDSQLVHTVLYACVGVLLCMVFLCSGFLVVAVLSSGKTSHLVFNSRNKNMCGRVLNGVIIAVMLLIQLLWVLVAAILALPVAALSIVHYMYYNLSSECVDLKYYAFSQDEYLVCGDDLNRMMFRSQPVFVGLIFALVGAVLTVKSMTFFILCASSNMMFLKESRFATYTQQNGKRSSSLGSHQDTKM